MLKIQQRRWKQTQSCVIDGDGDGYLCDGNDYLSLHLCFSGKCLKELTFEMIDLLVWQVFISDQSATTLVKARENSTRVSLSHILIISGLAKHAHLLSSILYSSSWMINLLLDGLLHSIMGYLYSSLVFWLALPWAHQNTAWLVKISHDTTH